MLAEAAHRQKVGWMLLVLACGVVAYANSLRAPFVYDDQTAIRDNQTIQRFDTALTPPARGAPVSGRPLVNLSFAVNYAIDGLDPRGYHALNGMIHLACALLLFGIVRLTLRSTAIAGISALIWTVHPLTSEVVDHAAARTESLMALCYLATLYSHIRARDSQRSTAWHAVSVAACAAGMACKESMATAPLMVMLYDARFKPRDQPKRRRQNLWPVYAALASTWILLALLVAGSPRAGSAGFSIDPGLARPVGVWTYLLNQAVIIARYLRLAIWPGGLVLDYGLPRDLTLSDAALPGVIVLVLLSLTIVALRRHGRFGFLGAWFFVTLAPSSSVIPIATEVGAERRMYLPLIALVVFIVVVGNNLRELLAHRIGDRTARALALTTVAVVVAGLTMATIRRNAEYESALSIWQTVVDRWPHGRAHYNLAMALKADGRQADALSQLREAVRDYPEAHYGLGVSLVEAGRSNEAIPHFQQFVRERPSHLSAIAAWTDLGIAYATEGKASSAVDAFRHVVSMVPGNANAHRNLANALLDGRDFDGAIAEARLALELNVNDSVAREILQLATAAKSR